MGSLNDIVTISITTESSRVTREGFGTPLIPSYNATFPERVRSYSAAADMVADGMAITTPEYLAAARMFAQEVSPEIVKVGRCTLKPTQRYDIAVVSVAHTTAYSVYVNGTLVTYTSDGSATNDEIATGLAAAIDAAQTTHTGTTTGSVGSLQARVTGDAAGNWVSIEIVNPALLSIAMNHADPGIATDLAAIALEDDDWYALNTAGFNSSALIVAAAAWVETAKKLYLVMSSDTAIAATVESGATDVAALIDTANYRRTFVMYHPEPQSFADSAWYGLKLPEDPGTENWAFATLAGVDPVVLTTQQRLNILAKSASSYYTVAGVDITFFGNAGDGTFIDLVRYTDKLEARIAEAVFTLLTEGRVPYTDEGAAAVRSTCLAVLMRDVQSGALAKTPKPTFTVPLVADVDPADRAARNLPDCEFTCTYAGAVNHVTINGVISV
jgi:hypothetical protein